jgi:MFS transporter, DHA3 family, tetracycline resistance protein
LPPRTRQIRLGAYPAYLILEGGVAFGFSLIVTVNLVWQAEVAGLNPLQLVLVGTVLEITALLGEVPTGLLADVYGRRLAIVLGVLMMAVGFAVEGTLPRFDAILLAQVIWGLGATFLSGATQAWISDEIGEDAASHAFLRGAQVEGLCTLIAIPPSVALASLRLNVPILAGAAVLLCMAALLAVLMPETAHAAGSERPMFGASLHRSMQAVRAKPIVLTLLALAAFFGAASEGFDRLWTPHMLQNFTLPTFGGLDSIAWFGVMRGGGLVLAVLATQAVRRATWTARPDLTARALFCADALRIGSIAVFALTTEFAVAVVMFWLATVLRRVARPVYTGWLNKQLQSASRATVLSMSGQMDSLGQIVGGPFLGAVATQSLRAALVLTAVVLAPALPLYVRASRSGR